MQTEGATTFPQYRKKRSAVLSEDIDQLLAELCVEWGFCNQLTASVLLGKCNRVHAADFAEAVLVAEGMNPESEAKCFRAIACEFTKRYGELATPENYDYEKKS